jgi:hypothetical protein
MLFKGTMFAGEKATLNWNRHVAYNGAAYPSLVEDLTNLDLSAWAQSNNAVVGLSNSTIDNVEQIGVASNGDVVLKVYTTGQFDPQVPLERFALATEENFVQTAGPQFQITFNLAGDYAPGGQGPVTVFVKNTGDIPAHNVSVQFSWYSIIAGANPQNLGTIAPGETKSANWTIRLPNFSAEFYMTAAVTSNSYGETFTATDWYFLPVFAAFGASRR